MAYNDIQEVVEVHLEEEEEVDESEDVEADTDTGVDAGGETEADETEAEADEETETLSTKVYPCPTCGMLFKEPEMCEKHAKFCTASSDESGAEWPEERILLLLDCMHVHYKKYLDMPPKKRQEHWKWIARIVGTTGDESRNRWNHLINSYNRIRNLKEKGCLRDKVWRFYDKIDKILGEGAVSRPEFVLSSMRLEANEDGLLQVQTGTLPPVEGEGEVVRAARLISLMEERYAQYCMTSGKERKMFWSDFADKLNISTEEARRRWNVLFASFKRTKLNRAQYVSRYGREPRHKWRFYDQMDRIIGNRFNPEAKLMVLPKLQPPASGVSVTAACSSSQLANLLMGGKPPPGTASVGAASTVTLPAGQPAGVFKLGPNGLLHGVPPATVCNVQATVLQAGTPQQQQVDIEAFTIKRKALFVEDYLRAKARREDHRMQLEERRIKALERFLDVIEARGNS